MINKRYRTTDESAVLGESLAGLFVVDTFLRAPTSFDHYIAVSPSLWWDGKKLASSASEHLATEGFPTERALFLSVADEADVLEAIPLLIAALQKSAPKGLTWWFEPMPEEHHNTIYHPATLRALRLIFGATAASTP